MPLAEVCYQIDGCNAVANTVRWASVVWVREFHNAPLDKGVVQHFLSQLIRVGVSPVQLPKLFSEFHQDVSPGGVYHGWIRHVCSSL